MKPLKVLLQLTENETDVLHHMFTTKHGEYAVYETFCEWIKEYEIVFHRSVTNSTISLYFTDNDACDRFSDKLKMYSDTIDHAQFKYGDNVDILVEYNRIIDLIDNSSDIGNYLFWFPAEKLRQLRSIHKEQNII